MSYDAIEIHLLMLQDSVRTEGYRRAIEAVVRPGDRVLDFGCGTGILSFVAARAGAEVVYAVDRSPMIRTARELAAANRLDNVRFFKGEAAAVELPGEVDVLISEFMGHFVFHEQMLPPLLALRDRWLAAGGAVIPARIGLWAALVGDPSGFELRRFFAGAPYGFDFSLVAERPFCEVVPTQLEPEQLLFDPIRLAELDLRTLAAPPAALGGEITPAADGTVYALCGWFDTALTGDVGFGTGPWDPPTHWCQLVFPLPRPFRARAGRPIRIAFEPVRLEKPEGTAWRWSIADDVDAIAVAEQSSCRETGPLPDGWLP